MNGQSRTTDGPGPGPLRSLGVAWAGQTVASLCWIGSVFAYGLTEVGDYLQLAAASAWFIANLFAAFSTSKIERRTN